MAELLPNYLGGRWQSGGGSGAVLCEPVLGDELVRVSAEGLNFVIRSDELRLLAPHRRRSEPVVAL